MCFEKPPKKWLFETHVASQRKDQKIEIRPVYSIESSGPNG